ncbi:hypothetical protein FA15DRAFT_664535 [Coprinopsis marcescibilis]|uniref:Beta-glucuronidase C-terminal domain-containing protein n=1 Tax=Coprinopsis marcescibilis TaxID=230819 RepID=A0A5C3L853_COPMA|nr:hypothetical protein FA15DRAFT_664535 [Coprinopsis marcescibilis]
MNLRALALLSGVSYAIAQVTVYGELPLGQTQSFAEWQTTTVRAAYNSTQLQVPALPVEAITNAFTMQLAKDAAVVSGLSIPHVGAGFFGFSIEMSVINQVLGKNSSFINVPFLNLMANIAERAGQVVVRLGGNTQEYAVLVDGDDPRLEVGHSYGKVESASTGTTLTPATMFTLEMLYTCRKISDMIDLKWFLGIPFNDSVDWRLAIVEYGEEILGDDLLGLQAGNEPDFYVQFGRRAPGYTAYDYFNEVGDLINVMAPNDRIPRKNILIAPSTSGKVWQAETVWETGFLDAYQDHMYGITVEYYPWDNCAAMYTGIEANIRDPQEILNYYVDHNNAIALVSPYHNTGNLAIQVRKPLMMFETNTASCGGFPGISNSYVAAIWGLDYGLQMAQSNFTHAMIHVGGQNVFYNPFTAPPTEEAAFNQWTVGPIFYSALIMAEVFGKSNTSRTIDLQANMGSGSTPAYAIYENDQISKVALFNFLSDPTGANDLSVALTVDGGVPASVNVKYLLAASITELNDITWAGQTFGNSKQADGRLRGDLNVTNVPCDQASNICRVYVPAPGFALVFFNDGDEALRVSQASQTFATTAWLKGHNTATFDLQAIQTSNGHGGAQRDDKSGTSVGFRKKGAAVGARKLGWGGMLALVGGVVGVWFGMDGI